MKNVQTAKETEKITLLSCFSYLINTSTNTTNNKVSIQKI